MKKALFYITCAFFLAMAQIAQGQVVFVQPLPLHSSVPQSSAKALLPSIVTSAFLPKTTEIVAKQLWVGDRDLFFQITARDFLQTKEGSYPRIFQNEQVKTFFLRLALVVIADQKGTVPVHHHDFTGTRLIRCSA